MTKKYKYPILFVSLLKYCLLGCFNLGRNFFNPVNNRDKNELAVNAFFQKAGGFIRKEAQVALKEPKRPSPLEGFSERKTAYKRKLKNKFGYLAWKTKRFTRRFSHILIKPTRQIAHITVVLIMVAIFSTSVFAKKQNGSDEFIADPFGIKVEREVSELNEMQVAAAVAEVFSLQMSEDAASFISQKLTVSLPISGNENFLAKPILATTTIPSNRKRSTITKYSVESGDTLWSIASKFDVTTDTVIWANNLEDEDLVKPSQLLTILPVPGVLHTVKSGDTVKGIAQKYKAAEGMVISFNDLEDKEITDGMQVIVPDGIIVAPLGRGETISSPRSSARNNQVLAPRIRVAPSYGGPNNFPWGYCTWWVASKRYVPWNGNAWQWYYNAQSMGYSTGKTPVPGAIMISWESPIGHVAYVEAVNGNSFTISEMNYQGYGIASRRTVTTGSVPLIGFVY